eukprot:13005367-Alexandrium_andersonii.AAC.1
MLVSTLVGLWRASAAILSAAKAAGQSRGPPRPHRSTAAAGDGRHYRPRTAGHRRGHWHLGP